MAVIATIVVSLVAMGVLIGLAVSGTAYIISKTSKDDKENTQRGSNVDPYYGYYPLIY